MARSRRRNNVSNRRLPTTRPRFTPRKKWHTPFLSNQPYEYFSETEQIVYERPARRALKRPLAQQKSRFPKTYGVSPYPLTNKQLTRTENKILNLCETRKMREQVFHAKKLAGRSGQKSPKWTKLSKVRC